MSNNHFDTAMNKFVEHIQMGNDEYMKANFPSLTTNVFSVDIGTKYVRIVKTHQGSGSRQVYCFVDKSNGDVLKAASWKTPAKHARGNIYTPENYGVNECGAKYLK